MADELDVAVVGAGPFGLSVAAWLDDRRTRLFGTPMQTWRTLMPPDMLMRSAWAETSLSARGGRGTIDEYVAATGERRAEPIPVQLFLRYADWFRTTYVPDHEEADVTHVAPRRDGYVVRTSAGGEAAARAVVVAVGVTPFPHVPPLFEQAVAAGAVGFAVQHQAFDDLAGRTVVIVGAGQAALETAALAADAGGQVEVLARSRVHWFADREPHVERGLLGQRLYRLAYPVIGYGPPPVNRIAVHPDVFGALPWTARERLLRRLLRSGGSAWIRSRVDARVRLSEGVTTTAVEATGDGVRLELSDGTRRDADLVLLATGYRFSLDRLDWLAPELRDRIRVERRWPALDRWFRSSVETLSFVGFPAEGRFGPIARFVLGADFSARRVRAGLDRGRPAAARGRGPRA